MSKLVQRLTIFFAGVPVILGLVYISALHYLPFNLLIIFVSAFATYELSIMFGTNEETISRPLLVLLSALIPLAEYTDIYLKTGCLAIIALVTAVFIIFTFEIFSAKDFVMSNARIARSICAVLYAGFLPSFITRLSYRKTPFAYIATFLVIVFISDSAAWLFGMLFGKGNRGKIAASPNKSIAGFIGAYLGSFVFALIMTYIFKDSFTEPAHTFRIVKVALLSVVVCSAAIIGDLAESVFKRSAEVKDSGNIVLGRGGVLDSVDSILMAAPFYYFLTEFLFK